MGLAALQAKTSQQILEYLSVMQINFLPSNFLHRLEGLSAIPFPDMTHFEKLNGLKISHKLT